MYALSAMDGTLQGIFFLIAVVLFIVAAFVEPPRIFLVPLGLAFATFVFMWNAFAAA